MRWHRRRVEVVCSSRQWFVGRMNICRLLSSRLGDETCALFWFWYQFECEPKSIVTDFPCWEVVGHSDWKKSPQKFMVMCIMFNLAFLECFTIVLAMGIIHQISFDRRRCCSISGWQNVLISRTLELLTLGTRTRQLNEFVVFLCIVHYGFNFLPFYPDFYYWS